MKLLVTGGAGFIGSHLAERLILLGHDVTLIDNFDTFYSPLEKQENVRAIGRAGAFGIHDLDICDADRLREVVRVEAPEAVVHLAALAGVRPSFDRPLEYARVNVGGTTALLEACRAGGVKKVVFASSSSIYGAASRVPFREDEVDNKPVSPYAATKLAGEQLCHAYTALGKMSIVCLRLFSVFGPRLRPDLAIRKFAEAIAQGKPLTVFGDGQGARDYTYVDDIVAGFVAALDLDRQFEVINLGGSSPVSLKEVIAGLELLIGRKARIVFADAHPADVPVTCADLGKARSVLGWRPCTPFFKGLEQFVEWHVSRGVAAVA